MNTYDLSGKYGIGYTSNGYEFYFDLEDYDKIKKYTWRKQSNGYIVATKNKLKQNIYLHRLILGEDKCQIDHIYHRKNDCRKSEMRVVTASQNAINRKRSSRNTSGIVGVHYSAVKGKWIARIGVNKKTIALGSYNNFEDAVAARKAAEKEYFGEYAFGYNK